jgi:hypothetical protein
MREPKEVEVDGVKYTICHLRPTKSIKLMTKLAIILSPGIGGAAKSEAKSKSEDSISSLIDSEISTADLLEGVVSKLSDESVLDLMCDVLQETLQHNGIVDGEERKGINKKITKENFDVAFDGLPLFHPMKLCKEAFEVSFGDFLGDRGFLGQMAAKAGISLAK